MTLFRWLAVGCLLISGGGCGLKGKNLLPDPTIDILSHPTSIEAYRTVHDAPSAVKGRNYNGPDEWVVDMYGDFAERVANVLFDEKTYYYPKDSGWRYRRQGIFFPIAGYRFWKGRDWVEVELDFDMDQMVIRTYMEGSPKVEQLSAYFDGSHDRLVALIQEAFPADPAIKALRQ